MKELSIEEYLKQVFSPDMQKLWEKDKKLKKMFVDNLKLQSLKLRSMPKGRKKLDNLEKALFYQYYKIGIDYYNKDYDSLSRGYLGKQIPREFKNYLEKLYPKFKRLTDKAIKGEKPTKQDQDVIKKALLDIQHYEIIFVKEGERWIPLIHESWPNIPPKKHFKEVIFKWVCRVWQGGIPVKRCKAGDCDKIFIPSRSDQEYCSQACIQREYRRRKKKLSVS